MSVFQHDYRPYAGPTTALWSRPLVLARYGLAEAWGSKITIGLFVLGLLPCVVDLVLIYLANNPVAKMLVMRGSPVLEINERFFLGMLETQCWFALVLASWVAPRLVSFDLGDNALPILLSHPISRFGYVAGKFMALSLSLSYVTWVPLLVLFAVDDGAPGLGIWNIRGRGAVDCGALPDRARRVVVGEVAGHRDRCDVCSGVCPRRSRRNCKCDSAHEVGIAAEHAGGDVGIVAAAAWRTDALQGR
jgi:hypothetical protein